MNLIYIVEPEDMVVARPDTKQGNSKENYQPNFTIPSMQAEFATVSPLSSAERHTTTSSWSPQNTITLAAALLGGPYTRLLVAAASAAPTILDYLTKTRKAPDKPGDEPTTNAEEDARAAQAIERFFVQHAITINIASERGYQFPPGHPLVGQSYKLHPLAQLPGSEKAKVYILHESYDETLLEEREAELLRLLVELGATKVTISEKSAKRKATNLSGEVGVNVAGVAGGTIQAASTDNIVKNNFDTREFELIGKPWRPGDKLDKSKFGWLAFEPSWGAMIVAREVGECTKAAIEIKEETVFASEKRISMAVKAKLTDGKAAIDYLSGSESGRTYFIKAEFAPFMTADSVPIATDV